MGKRRAAGGRKAATKGTARKTAGTRKTSGGRKEQPRKSTSTLRGTAPGTAVTSDAVTQSDAPVPAPDPVSSGPRLARVVGITPQDRELVGYRELDVKAVLPGQYAGRNYAAGDVFRMALVGEGEAPPWVRPVG